MVRLTLHPRDPSGTTYLFDGKPEKMRARTVTVERLRADGALDRITKTFYFGRQGAILVKPDANLTWGANIAYALGDPNRYNTRMFEQWLGIGTAATVGALKQSLDRVVGLPWVNTMAADRNGGTLYADASVVPNVSNEQARGPCLLNPTLLMLDGSTSACAWKNDPGAPVGIVSPLRSPSLLRQDYVGNSNDTYWMTNPHALLVGPGTHGYSPMYGAARAEQSMRTRLGVIQLEQAIMAKKTLGPRDLEDLMFSNRIYAAELILPDLLRACAASPDEALATPCKVLAAWDRRADLDSRGYILFREFWFMASRLPQRWAVPFDPVDPLGTPRGLNAAVTASMLDRLKTAVGDLGVRGIPLDAEPGDFQDHLRAGARVPIHGGYGDREGAYNAVYIMSPPDSTGYHNVDMGPTYLQIVGFDADGPVARGMLVYGQSTDPASPHYADQLSLYSRKQWATLPFTPAQMRVDLARQK